MKVFFSLVWRGWKKFAHVLGIVNTKILLTVSYFVVLSIVTLVQRVAGQDMLDRRMKPVTTYWKTRKPVDAGLDACRRMF